MRTRGTHHGHKMPMQQHFSGLSQMGMTHTACISDCTKTRHGLWELEQGQWSGPGIGTHQRIVVHKQTLYTRSMLFALGFHDT